MPYESVRLGHWCSLCSAGKTEKLCRNFVEKWIAIYYSQLYTFNKARPEWLKWKKRLEFDGYNKELKMAFEYNGIQHRKYTPHFHRKGIHQFYDQLLRDKQKIKVCIERDIFLLTIPDKYTCYQPDKLEEFIREEILQHIIYTNIRNTFL
jgi:hypothetical protein